MRVREGKGEWAIELSKDSKREEMVEGKMGRDERPPSEHLYC